MIYIDVEQRKKLLEKGVVPNNSAELGFLLAVIIRNYLEAKVRKKATLQEGLTDVVGVLENQKLEVWKRFILPLSVRQIEEKGDVYIGEVIPGAKADGKGDDKEPEVQGVDPERDSGDSKDAKKDSDES